MGDELRAQLGRGIEGDANAVGNKDANINHNVVNVDADSLADVREEIRSIKLEQVLIKRDISDLKDGQRDTKNAINTATTEIRAVSVRVETALNNRTEKPVTLVQVVSAILAVVFLILIVLMLGMWLGGLR